MADPKTPSCSCADWKPETDKLNAPLFLAQARNPATKFDFKPWRFCPWCGRSLTAASVSIISDTCEVWLSPRGEKVCGKPTVAGYPAMGGGFMPLCAEHAPKHASITQPVEDIRAGVPHPLTAKKSRLAADA
jgi:hypothetical protein